MNAPIWWTPVMSDLKAMIEEVMTQPQHEASRAPLWEFFRSTVAEAVRAGLIPRGLSEQRARVAVGALIVTMLEEFKKPVSERDSRTMAERWIELEESWSKK